MNLISIVSLLLMIRFLTLTWNKDLCFILSGMALSVQRPNLSDNGGF